MVAARRGGRATAAALDRWLASQTGRFPPGAAHLERARIAAARGDASRALDLIETLPLGTHPVDVILFHSDPALGRLRGEERWTRWLRPKG